MTVPFNTLHVARVVIEAQTPLSVASGAYDARFDTLLVRDFNDLPAIPGTSLAGVLRRLYEARHGEDIALKLFGHALGSDHDSKSFEGSRLTVSWAHVHDRDDQPVETFQPQRTDTDDPILTLLRSVQPIQRDNVRINGKTAAVDDRGKFSRAAVPRGTRFTFELSYWATAEDSPKNADDGLWVELLALLDGGIRLGGATRRGLGMTKVHRVRQLKFDLRKQLDAYQKFQKRDFERLVWCKPPKLRASTATRRALELQLQAEDFVGIGLSDHPYNPELGKKAPQRSPRHEHVIDYSNQDKIRERCVVFPGSSIKGALRHRTQFHLNRLAGSYIGGGSPTDMPNLDALFGSVTAKAASGAVQAQAGQLYIDDVFLDENPKSGVMMHNSLDRFSAGTRDGVLFSEELLFEAPLNLKIEIDGKITDVRVRDAFKLALEDLATGRLALGGGSAKGHGYFREMAQATDKAKPSAWRQVLGGLA